MVRINTHLRQFDPPISVELIREVSSEGYGCFLTDFGSILPDSPCSVSPAFASMKGDWAKYPASLPQGWTKIEVDRL